MVSHMSTIFDSTTKQRFGNENDPAYIKFGTIKDKDTNFNIRSGQLKLMGSGYLLPINPNNLISSQVRCSKVIRAVCSGYNRSYRGAAPCCNQNHQC
jgi:hypothetical protein